MKIEKRKIVALLFALFNLYITAIEATLMYTSEHIYCFINCALNPENPFDIFGDPLIDFDIPWGN